MNFEQDNFLHGRYAALGQELGDVFIYDQEGPRLLLNRSHPSVDEINTARNQALELALYATGQVLFLLFRFGNERWSDAPYSLQLNAPERRGLCEEFQKGDRYTVRLQLRHYENGATVVNRLARLSPEFSFEMHQLIAHHLFQPLTYNNFRRLTNLAYQEFPRPDDMAASAIIRCVATN